MSGAPEDKLRVGLVIVPAGLLSTFGSAVLYGRQQIRTYSTILVAQACTTFVLSCLFVAGFGWGVLGALTASVIVTWLLAIAVVVAVARLSGRATEGTPVSYRSLMKYGSRIYPSSITGYFNYRIDVFIIQALMVGQSGQLGLYSIAVTMAELLFYVPDSVTMIFLARVSGSTPAEADAMLPRVARLTVFITCLGALAIIPVAFVGIHLILPRFAPCLPAFLVLLPGVVSIALAKVLTSYIAGRGRPGLVSICGGVALATNIVANLVLIPRLGIVGAATASLISYSALAGMLLFMACRLSRLSPLAIVVPGMAEVRFLWAAAAGAIAALRTRWQNRGRGARPGEASGEPDSGQPS
jgi:O-antigen/teichoic acid export membrane protein